MGYFTKGQGNGPNKVTFKQGSEGNKDISERKQRIKTGKHQGQDPSGSAPELGLD